MSHQLSAILIGSDAKAKASVQSAFSGSGDRVRLVAVADDVQQGMRQLQSGPVQIVLLDVNDLDQGVREIGFIVSRFPRTAVFVTATERTSDWILRLIHAGASEYLTKPLAAAELLQAVDRVSLREALAGGAPQRKGSVISVYNPSGGMGTTTIAVNLAALFASQGKKAALIDLNLHAGDVAAFLDLTPRYTLASAAAKMGQLDADFIRSVTMTHPSGVEVLNAPDDLEEAEKVVPELLQEIIGLFRTVYDYTVVDTGGPVTGCNVPVFKGSDHILFNTIVSLPALRNAKRYLAALDRAGLGDNDRIKLVVNRHLARDDIKVGDTEKVLNTKVFQTMPNCYSDVKAAINKGVPVVTESPKSPLTKALDGLVQKLSGGVPAASPSIFRR